MKSSDQLFRSIYEQYYRMVHDCARRYGVAEADIEDIVHDTFLAYYRNYPLTWEGKQIRKMLERIARNKSIDYKRKNARKPEVLYDPQHMEETEGVVERLISKDSLSVLIDDEKQKIVWEGLKEMRSDWSQVFMLHIIHGYPIREVSRILNTTEAACRTRLSRGRKFLLDYVRKRLG